MAEADKLPETPKTWSQRQIEMEDLGKKLKALEENPVFMEKCREFHRRVSFLSPEDLLKRFH